MGGIPADETFDGTFPFAPHFTTAPGFRMHYVDEGSGEAIVLIHGEPTWGYLYREFIPVLSRRWRTVVPDLMGFGKSETPADPSYTLARHASNVGALIEDLDLRGITLVMHDWGGPIGTLLAARYPDRMKRFVSMNSFFGVDRNVREERLSPWFEAIKTMEDAGQFEAVMGQLRFLVGSIMVVIGLERREVMTDTWLRAYSAAFPSPKECRAAIAFPQEALHVDRIRDDLRAALPRLFEMGRSGIPAMLIQGMRDHAIWPHVALAGFKAFFPHGTVHSLPGVGHFIQEDAPETAIALIEEFCLRT